MGVQQPKGKHVRGQIRCSSNRTPGAGRLHAEAVRRLAKEARCNLPRRDRRHCVGIPVQLKGPPDCCGGLRDGRCEPRSVWLSCRAEITTVNVMSPRRRALKLYQEPIKCEDVTL